MHTFFKVISYVLHPVVIPTCCTFLYFICTPHYIEPASKNRILFAVFMGTYFIPIIFLYLLKSRKHIQSIQLHTIAERKTPFIFMIIILFWIGIQLFKHPVSTFLSISFFASSAAIILAYILLYYKLKVSMHGMAIMSVISFFIAFRIAYTTNVNLILMVAFIVAGVVLSARLFLKAHTIKELVYGSTIGFFMPLVCYAVYFLFLV